MNLDTLAKHYDKLSPRERFALMLAASIRDDEQEVLRLASAEHSEWYHFRDCHPHLFALEKVVAWYMIRQLNMVVLLLHARSAWLGAPPGTQQVRLWKAFRMGAYCLVRQAEGWRLFCEGLSVDPEGVLLDSDGYENLKDAEKVAREGTFSPEEALAYMSATHAGRRTRRGTTYEIELTFRTPQSDANELRARFDEVLAEWGGRRAADSRGRRAEACERMGHLHGSK